MLFNTLIDHLANDDIKLCYTLIELSTNQWRRYCDNSIIVTGIREQKMSKPNTHLKYSKVSVGKNLHLKKRLYKSKGKPVH